MRPLPIVGCRRVLVTAVGLVFAVHAVGCSASPATSAQACGGDRQVSACPRPASLGRAPTAFDGPGLSPLIERVFVRVGTVRSCVPAAVSDRAGGRAGAAEVLLRTTAAGRGSPKIRNGDLSGDARPSLVAASIRVALVRHGT